MLTTYFEDFLDFTPDGSCDLKGSEDLIGLMFKSSSD